jgi:hypothetical protein
MVVLWSWDHDILGELSNGMKVIITNIHGGWGDKQTIRIDPIEAVYGYFPGVKNIGFVSTLFTIENFPDHSNIMYIQADADADGAELSIISFGV